MVSEGLLFALLCSLLKNQRGLLVHCVYKFYCPQHEVEPGKRREDLPTKTCRQQERIWPGKQLHHSV